MKKAAVMLVLIAVVSGCQSVSQQSPSQVLDNHTFMSLWNTYQHCTSGSDLDQLRTDVQILTAAPQFRTSSSDFTIPLPEMLLRHVSAQPTRTAADPKAMLAACSLHTAQVASDSGKSEVAVELLNGLLHTHASGEYGYYIQQAKAALHRVQPSAVYVGQPSGTSGIGSVRTQVPAVSVPHTSLADSSAEPHFE